mmetsp:Transcript_11810/g.28268  ORF Transcript_11810/g.28268 Transcript_11810/m.28268 type:complete len:103 (+) Transcript_11810:150-458(+)
MAMSSFQFGGVNEAVRLLDKRLRIQRTIHGRCHDEVLCACCCIPTIKVCNCISCCCCCGGYKYGVQQLLLEDGDTIFTSEEEEEQFMASQVTAPSGDSIDRE